MTLKQSLQNLIESNLAGRTVPFAIDERTALIEAGLVDSVTLMEIVLLIEQQTGIQVPDDEITPDNFATIGCIDAMVAELERRRSVAAGNGHGNRR